MQSIILGAAESTEIGKVPTMSTLDLHMDAAYRAIEDAGIERGEIDGIACSLLSPVDIAYELGVIPSYVDGTNVGGSSPMAHVRHAAAAISAGLCRTVLVVHGQSGYSGVGRVESAEHPSSALNVHEAPYGLGTMAGQFGLSARAFMNEFGVSDEELAAVPVAQRAWAAQNPRAFFRSPLTVDEVLSSRRIAGPLHLFECCPVTDAGGALIITSEATARASGRGMDRAIAILGAGEAVEAPHAGGMRTLSSSRAFRHSAQLAFSMSGLSPADVQHAMLYDAFAHLPLIALQDLGLVEAGEAARFVAAGETAPGGSLPLNTSGGGLSYTHPGQYGMFAIQESVRQLRGEASAQLAEVDISIAHGNGGAFSSAGTLILGSPRTID